MRKKNRCITKLRRTLTLHNLQTKENRQHLIKKYNFFFLYGSTKSNYLLERKKQKHRNNPPTPLRDYFWSYAKAKVSMRDESWSNIFYEVYLSSLSDGDLKWLIFVVEYEERKFSFSNKYTYTYVCAYLLEYLCI